MLSALRLDEDVRDLRGRARTMEPEAFAQAWNEFIARRQEDL